jgi:hypothetical protein
MPCWGTSLPAGPSVLLCLLLTGCSHPCCFIHETPPPANLVSDSFFNFEDPTQLQQTARTPANHLPVSLPDEVATGDAVAPSFANPNNRASSLDEPCSLTPLENTPQTVWGPVEIRGFPIGRQVAANGVEYHPLFMLGLDFNIMLWRERHVYLFFEASFWGQRAAAGITNPSQGAFDFSKREFDFNLGAAWNYSGNWEARFFGYSFNNLNRGNSQTSPSGYNDGVGLENRYYLGQTYAHLGTATFDQARATFLSVGFYPSKSMEDGNGNQFYPGPFVRAYLTLDLWIERYYLYGDIQLIGSRSFQPTLLNLDAGVAARPFTSVPRLEFRAGAMSMFTLQDGDLETGWYLSMRYVY